MNFFRLKTEGFDYKLFACALLLSLIGVLLIYSAKHASTPNEKGLFIKQLFWLSLSLLAAAIIFMTPLRLHEILSYLYYLSAVLLLLAVFFIGATRLGATRWFE